MGSRRWSERFALLLLRLYPRAFRERYGAEVRSALSEAVGEGGSGGRLVWDALSTLVRAWADRVREGRPSFGTISGVERTNRGGGIVSDWAGDLRFALRGLVRNPLHGAVAVLTLALAMGANAAVFDVAWSVLVRTLPYDSPERVMRVEPSPVHVTANDGFAVSRSLADLPQVEAASAFTEGGAGSLVAGSAGLAAEPVRVTHVDGRFFDVLGARLVLGRPPRPGGGEGPEVVLSQGLWQRLFGGDVSAIGRTIQLSGHTVTVTGVAAADVAYPAGTDVWLSYPVLYDLMGSATGGDAIVRLRRAQQRFEVRDLFEARQRAEWEANGGRYPEEQRPRLIPLREALVGRTGDSLTLLFAASSLVLVLGCVNLAGLSLARHAARAGEFAVRRALGAGRLRLVRLLLTEAFAIAVLASIVALAFAAWGRALLTRLLPPELPGLAAVAGAGASGAMLAFTACVALVAGVLIGSIPAIAFWLGDRTSAAVGRLAERRRRLHPALVVAEVALAVVLVVSAGLLGRSVVALRAVPLGFDTDRVVTFEARLPWEDDKWDPAAFNRFAAQVQAELGSRPGIRQVGVASRLPLSDGLGVGMRVWPASRAMAENEPSASALQVSSTYFDALGIDLLAGGPFAADESARGTIVVSRSLAERMFGRTDVVGELVRIKAWGEPEQATIVGVAADTRPTGFAGETRAAMYFPFQTQPAPAVGFAVRTEANVGDLAAIIREVVQAADPRIAPFAIRSLRDAASATVAAHDALALVSTIFGGAALLLALLGIYGLSAQTVIRRRRELGIRLAVGAHTTDLLRMVIRGSVLLAGAGVLLGLIAAGAVTRLLAGFLFGVTATDPATFAAVAALALLVAVAASAGPAVRAARTDPVTSLRSE